MNFEAKNAFIQRAQAALGFSGSQLRHLITQHPDLFPLYTVKGKWKHESRMAQRFELGTWTNVGHLWFHDGLSIYPRCQVPGYGPALRRFLHRANSSAWGPPNVRLAR
jgi:hypothetical protein